MNCTRPLPKSVRALHNARPAKQRPAPPATAKQGRTTTASQGVDVLQNRAKMCGSPDGNGLRATTTREAGINPSQGVDESESRAKMGGSLRTNGHGPPNPKHAEEADLTVGTGANVAREWPGRRGRAGSDRSS